MSENLPDDLPEGYYLANFEYLLTFVSERYDHLLAESEKLFAARFLSLDEAARKYYVRLSNRKGTLFRLDRLDYPELGEPSALVAQLVSAQLLEVVVPPVEEAVRLCLKSELARLACNETQPRSCRKETLVEQILAAGDCNPVRELGIQVIELQGQDQVAVFRLLFFGNFHQDMTEFVLHELVTPFEQYEVSPSSGVFPDRTAVDAMIRLQALSEISHEVVAADDVGDAVLALAAELPGRPTERLPARRFDRIVNRLARHLERLGRPDQALLLYQQTPAAPSRERQARILHQLAAPEKALVLCQQIAAQPQNDEELEFARAFAARVARKHQVETPVTALQPLDLPQDLIRVRRTDERVELCAANWFEAQGVRCFYVENSLMMSLFGLYFWDIIFAAVPGAFFNPFQRGPADLYTSDFVPLRQALIDRRLEELEDRAAFSERINRTASEKAGIANQFVYWPRLDRELIALALERIPTGHFRAVFERLLADLRHNSSGFPDLVLFPGDSYELIEIKGPGDRIQKNQARWFRCFSAEGIPARLVNVEYI